MPEDRDDTAPPFPTFEDRFRTHGPDQYVPVPAGLLCQDCGALIAEGHQAAHDHHHRMLYAAWAMHPADQAVAALETYSRRLSETTIEIEEATSWASEIRRRADELETEARAWLEDRGV